jgi:hypothetical protein
MRKETIMKRLVLIKAAFICAALFTMSQVLAGRSNVKDGIAANLDHELLEAMDHAYIAPSKPQEEKEISPKEKQKHKKSDKNAAKLVADYVVSQDFVTDVNAFVTRSADPLKTYIRDYFFHCDFHKDQLRKMKQCFGEFEQLLKQTMPICVHALFSYIVSDAMKEHVQATAENALRNRTAMAVYTAPSIMEHIEEQDGVLTHFERQQFIQLKEQWNQWYERWEEYLKHMSVYIEARTEVREEFLDKHKRSLLFSMLWAHAMPGIWFLVSNFRIAKIMFGSSVRDANYFLMKLMLRLHDNVVKQRTGLEQKIIERTQHSMDLYLGIINQVIDENLARF